MSGLAAAVQAGQNGNKTILLEVLPTVGGVHGMGVGVEGGKFQNLLQFSPISKSFYN
jgi:succinate dehydrogenase/fumarate reductase flavoprotein subunit